MAENTDIKRTHVSRKNVLDAFVKGATGALSYGAADALGLTLPGKGEVSQITHDALLAAYGIADKNMRDIFPDGFPRVSTYVEKGDPDRTSGILARLEIIDPNLAELAVELNNTPPVDTERVTEVILKEAHQLYENEYKDYKDPQKWIARFTPLSSQVLHSPLEARVVTGKQTSQYGVTQLTLNSAPLHVPLVDDIIRHQKPILMPNGIVFSFGLKFSPYPNSKTQVDAFAVDPHRLSLAAYAAHDAGLSYLLNGTFVQDKPYRIVPLQAFEGSLLTKGDNPLHGFAIVQVQPGNDSNFERKLTIIPHASEGRWRFFESDRLCTKTIAWADYIGDFLAVGTGDDDNIATLRCNAVSLEYASAKALKTRWEEVIGFAEMSGSSRNSGRERTLVVPLDGVSPSERIKKLLEGENQYILGKIGKYTIIGHEVAGELIGVSAIGGNEIVLDKSGSPTWPIAQRSKEFTRFLPFSSKEEYNIAIVHDSILRISQQGASIATSLSDLDIAPQKTSPPNRRLLLSQAIQTPKIDVALETGIWQTSLENGWTCGGIKDKITLSRDAVLVYIPGAGSYYNEKELPTLPAYQDDAMGAWSVIKNIDVLPRAKRYYDSLLTDLAGVRDYKPFFETMQAFGYVTIPWKCVQSKEQEQDKSSSSLAMAIQTYRIIEMIGAKEVVLIGHSKGANVLQIMLKMAQDGLADPFLKSTQIKAAVTYGRIMPPPEMIGMLAAIAAKINDPKLENIEILRQVGQIKSRDALAFFEKVFGASLASDQFVMNSPAYQNFRAWLRNAKGMVVPSGLWSGIDGEKLMQKGIRAVELYDSRDPMRFSVETMEYLINQFLNKGATQASQAYEKIPDSLLTFFHTMFGDTLGRHLASVLLAAGITHPDLFKDWVKTWSYTPFSTTLRMEAPEDEIKQNFQGFFGSLAGQSEESTRSPFVDYHSFPRWEILPSLFKRE